MLKEKKPLNVNLEAFLFKTVRVEQRSLTEWYFEMMEISYKL